MYICMVVFVGRKGRFNELPSDAFVGQTVAVPFVGQTLELSHLLARL